MRLIIFLVCSIALCKISPAQSNDSIIINKIFTESLTRGKAYQWLEYLCKETKGRLSGTPQSEKALNYVSSEIRKLYPDNFFLQNVMVPRWERGEKETASVIINGKSIPVNICALGGSIPTSLNGLEAEVIEIYDFEDLKKLGKDKIRGKIVFVNHPLNPAHYNTFKAYSEAGPFRWRSPSEVAKYGAAGVVVRSMTLALDDVPHTGSIGYVDTIPKIPACAISTIGAELLSKSLKENSTVKFKFRQNCKSFDDVPSHNLIAEIRGTQFPDEIIVIGGHIDAWDLGEGAHDNGAGVVHAMEVINLFRSLNIEPKRTIRIVAFMNEENGGRGGKKFAEEAHDKKENIIAAIESDAGAATPTGFSFRGDTATAMHLWRFEKLLEPYGYYNWRMGYAGVDIDHLHKHGTLCIGHIPDSQRYFDYHHSESDTFDKIHPRELAIGAAGIASLAWLISEYGLK